MKQLAEEVESLKQQILKKHLGKMKDPELTDERKKMRKSQSYQGHQELNDGKYEFKIKKILNFKLNAENEEMWLVFNTKPFHLGI